MILVVVDITNAAEVHRAEVEVTCKNEWNYYPLCQINDAAVRNYL